MNMIMTLVWMEKKSLVTTNVGRMLRSLGISDSIIGIWNLTRTGYGIKNWLKIEIDLKA